MKGEQMREKRMCDEILASQMFRNTDAHTPRAEDSREGKLSSSPVNMMVIHAQRSAAKYVLLFQPAPQQANLPQEPVNREKRAEIIFIMWTESYNRTCSNIVSG